MDLFRDDSALLVVDMVRDFAHPQGALPVPDAVEIIDDIAELAGEARGKGIPVIYANDAHEPDDEEFEKWPPHAVSGTPGAEVVEELEPHPEDHVVEKKRFSAFFDTELDSLLRGLDVGHLVITGTVTNICVLATALDATMRGYEVTVPRFAVAGLDSEDHEYALKQIDQVLGGEVL